MPAYLFQKNTHNADAKCVARSSLEPRTCCCVVASITTIIIPAVEHIRWTALPQVHIHKMDGVPDPFLLHPIDVARVIINGALCKWGLSFLANSRGIVPDF